ncbi:helix-turn-helix domain-containing protein [Paenibacillus kribbensis]|uniref:helix-turn-helix domain-containing protein n=1 Tax=Paenibacillus kribbensis TaxID=172713 RepID=UPI00210C0B15|nr:helix-turn-helix domain-containing protein [Paenibacillus kribbensis]
MGSKLGSLRIEIVVFQQKDKQAEIKQEEVNTYMKEEMLKALGSYPPLLDVNHIKEILMVGENVAYQEMKSGKFPVMKVGKQIRVAKVFFAKYIIESSCGTE